MSKQRFFKLGTLVLRWTIAIVGIAWVLNKISWRDEALAMLPGADRPVKVKLVDFNASESQKTYKVADPVSGKVIELQRADVLNEPDQQRVTIDRKKEYLLAVDANDRQQTQRLLVADTSQGAGRWVAPDQASDYDATVAHPRVEIGVLRMVRGANLWFLLASIVVMPITFIITSYRWHELLKALDVRITLSRAFVLNMVGSFYNVLMPGSVGGDVLKAWYVAKQTHHGTRAATSVVVDRVIGLLALMVLGGTMAALQWRTSPCLRVAVLLGFIVAGTAAALVVFYNPLLHRISGMELLISKLPWQKHVRKIVETLHILGRRPYLVAWAVLITFPVHMTVVTSAILAGMAFGLPIATWYYWMAVPVIVLSMAIPISPQGVGVAEYFAVKLMHNQGVTVAQALALTMSIRVVQILWNLSGAFFVMRGGYHAPTQIEKKDLSQDEDQAPLERTTVPPADE